MLKTFRDRMADFLNPGRVAAPINENSSLHEISVQYANLPEFVERKYGVKVDAENKTLSLREFVEKYGLPPAQIVFMEVQLDGRMDGVQNISAKEAWKLLRDNPETKLLDIRDAWEVKICKLPHSRTLTPQLLDEILTEWPKDGPILFYCHYGVRSLDAATFLADRGFTSIYALKGGIEAWALDVDPTLPRYQNAYC